MLKWFLAYLDVSAICSPLYIMIFWKEEEQVNAGDHVDHQAGVDHSRGEQA
jgi:hypothetical protein